MEDSNNVANNVAQAIATALDWTCTSDARKAAVTFLDSVISLFSSLLSSTLRASSVP